MADDANIHRQLGQIIEAVGALKDGLENIGAETSALKDNSIKLTGIVNQMAPIVAAHQEIAGSIKKEYIPRLDEHHAYVELLIKKAAFWQSVRDQLIRKGIGLFVAAMVAAILYLMGFEHIAQKLIWP